MRRLFRELQAAEEELQSHQQSLAAVEKEAFRIDRTAAEKQSRLEILRQLNEEGEGLAKGSRAVLKGLDDPERIRPALAGALVSNLDVHRDYIRALEAAFGRNMHAVVLQDARLATEILRSVVTGNLGQAALALPELTAIATDDHLVDLPRGAIAWAIDKLEAPATIAPLVRRLLRGVAIVADLETALRLKKEHPVLQFATIAGEFISTAGVIFGGTATAQTESLLGRKALISETAAELCAIGKGAFGGHATAQTNERFSRARSTNAGGGATPASSRSPQPIEFGRANSPLESSAARGGGEAPASAKRARPPWNSRRPAPTNALPNSKRSWPR